MKHTFKLSLLCSAILLAGCGDNTSSSGTSDKVTFEPEVQALLERGTSIKFTLQGTNADVPAPSYLLMDTSDGTLGLPTNGDDALTNPLAAMNTVDGWSTSMPIVLNFEGDGFGESLAPVFSGVSVIKLNQRLTDWDGQSNPIVEVLQIQDGMTADADFQVVSQGNSLYIQFSDALDESSEYIFAVTQDITDKNGDPIGTSSSYALGKSTEVVYETGDLASIQAVTKGVEELFKQTGIPPEDIVYSSWFSTQSVGDTLTAVKGITGLAMADPDNSLNDYYKIPEGSNLDLSSAYNITLDEVPEDFIESLNRNEAFDKYVSSDSSLKDAIITAYQNTLSAGGALEVEVTKGTVTLPIYLETGENWNQQPMESAMPSLAIVLNKLADSKEAPGLMAQIVELGIDPTKLASDMREQMKLVGAQLTLSDGSQLDPERIITRYSPVPEVKSLAAVNMLVFTPKGSTPNSVVIYQHGITSAKENAYAFAYNLAQQGIAVIATDLPLHGERSLDDQRSANSNILAYLNLENMPVARDNVRQSVLDVMGLRAGLSASLASDKFNNTPLAAMTSVKVLGHSLGGIVATTAVASANKELEGLSTEEQAKFNSLYGISGMSIHNSGGQISNLLLNSSSYGNLIKHSIAYSGSDEYKETFEALVAQQQCSSELSLVGSCFAGIYENMTAADQAKLESAFSQFGYATQTVLDTIDPFTNASDISSSLPVFMSQIQNDRSVPNSVPNTFAGTEPLAAKLGLSIINDTTVDPSAGNNLFKYKGITVNEDGSVNSTSATHSTFVFPLLGADAPYHADMQARNIEFLLNDQLQSLADPDLMEIE